MSSGVMVWALHFTAIYGLTALACARGWGWLVMPSIAASTLLASIAIGALLAIALPRRAQFEYWMSACVAALALVAIVWEALPVLMVPACG
jgi:hypothetical protein